MKLLPQPTIPGKARGIIGVDPIVLQCGVCGETLTQDHRSVATFIILSRYRFCTLEADSPRRCRECMADHARDCLRCADAIR